MNRQYRSPYIVNEGKVYRLQPVTGIFDEDWLQNFIFTHHQAIPINEIEPAFGPLIPVCRELPTKAGPIDMLFINKAGLPTLVECKLWNNPEARREVVGQILDYAKEISHWSYDDLQKALSGAQKVTEPLLYKLITRNVQNMDERDYLDEDADERDFIDSVSHNLRRGRFLLLIIGDGIRENVEQIAGFLQEYAHLNFSFALVEFGVFRSPSQNSGDYFIQPRVVAQTTEIARVVFRIEDNRIIPAALPEIKATQTTKRTKISEQVFFEQMNADAPTKAQLKVFFDKVSDVELNVEPGQKSMILKSILYGINFGVFNLGGYFYNCGIVSSTDEMGQPQIGEEYLSQLAKLLNGIVKPAKDRFSWTVKIKEKKGDRYASVAEVLAIQDKWLEVIQNTLDKIAKLDAK